MLTYRFHRGLGLAVLCALMSLGGGMARAGQAARGDAREARPEAACGDNQAICGEKEKCCENRIATFCQGETCSSVHVEGRCIAKTESCDGFWCGNRQCQATWLMPKDVCCIYYEAGNAPQYACASSELSCRGNSTSLTIRPTVASRPSPQGS